VEVGAFLVAVALYYYIHFAAIVAAEILHGYMKENFGFPNYLDE